MTPRLGDNAEAGSLLLGGPGVKLRSGSGVVSAVGASVLKRRETGGSIGRRVLPGTPGGGGGNGGGGVGKPRER
jgi:hypothetical protein